MKKIISCITMFCILVAFIPFGNFASATSTQPMEKSPVGEIDATKMESANFQPAAIEVISERTEFSKTFRHSDDTFTTEISQVPMHYLSENDEWLEIENELVRTKDGYENKANNLNVEFKDKISKDTVGLQINEDDLDVNLQLQSIETKKTESIQTTKGVVSENQITYADIFDNISAVYTVGENFVKEDIVIKDKPQNGMPKSFKYKLQLNGLTYKNINNAIYLYNESNDEAVFKIDAPFMYDSYVPEEFKSSGDVKSIPEESKSYDIQIQTVEKGGYLFIEMFPNYEWLTSTERIFPIVIDPTIYRIQGTDLTTDTILRSGFPTQVGGNDTEIGVGRSGDNIVRSLLRFDLSGIEKASKVLSVDLNLYLSSTNSTSSIDISIHKISNSWNENEATWQNRTASTKWGTAGVDYNPTAYTAVKNIATIPSKIQDGLVKWSLPVSNVNGWVDNPSINHGVLIKSTTESSKVYKKFYSSESTVDSAYKPKLVITYKTNARLGLEDYWDYYEYELTEGKGYVNIGTQNNVVQYTDFTLANYGDFGFEFKRTYNSKTIEESALGKGTTFTGSEKLFINTGATNSNLEYQDADGTVHQFEINGSNYVNPAGFLGKLSKIDANTFELSEENKKTTFKIREVKVDTPVQVAYITKQEDLYGHTISYNYNSSHQLTSIVTGLGDTLTFKYRNGYLVEAISKNKKVVYEYLANHFIQWVEVYDVSETTPKLLSKTKLYYSNNQLSKIIDSMGNTTTFTYNSDGVKLGLDTITLKDKDNQDGTTTTFALDNTNLKATVSKPGEDIEYILNNNYVVTAVIQEGSSVNYTLDNDYLIQMVTTIEDGVSKTTAYNYNSLKKINEIKEDGALLSSYDYSNGKLVKQTDQDGTVTEYDEKERVKSQTKDNKTIKYTYDNHGNLATVTYQDGTSEKYVTTYNTTAKEITNAYTNQLGNQTKKVYDYSGNLVRATNGRNYTTTYTYSAKNELTSVTTPNNKKTGTYQYDGNGNLKKAINLYGNTFIELAYNKDNKIEKETFGAQGVDNQVLYVLGYDYNEAGDLSKITKSSGDVITYEVDKDTQTSIVSVNNQKKFETVESETETTYKNLDTNQTTKYVKGVGDDLTIQFNGKNTIQYDYEKEKLQSVTYNTNKLIYEYLNDNLNILKLNNTKLAKWEYNEYNLETEVNFGNEKSKIVTGYDETNTQIKTEKFFADSPSKPFQTNEYIYDANGQVKEIKNELGITTYTYGVIDQLEKEVLPNGTSIEYNYDDLGNRVSKKITKNGVTTSTSYRFNGANQIISDGANTFTYDRNGNLGNDGRYQYTWNAFDQLTTVKTAAGAAVASYKYDEKGRRIYSKVGSTETYYRYDGSSNRVLFEENASGVITKAYTYDENRHPLTMTYNGSTYYYLTNYRGDVLALTDANGAVVAEYTYDAWGNILTSKGTMASINPYRYAGYRYDEETKLYYLMARYYNPDTGVFLSLDPVRGEPMNPVSMNGYNYANNNPVMVVDPDGQNPILYGALAGALINAIIYYVSLINKHGIKKAHKHISGWKLTLAVLRGAAAGALGYGAVKVLIKLGNLNKVGSALLSLHIAPATYLIGNTGSYSAKGLTENQVLSLFGQKGSVIYHIFKPILQKIINKYRK